MALNADETTQNYEKGNKEGGTIKPEDPPNKPNESNTNNGNKKNRNRNTKKKQSSRNVDISNTNTRNKFTGGCEYLKGSIYLAGTNIFLFHKASSIVSFDFSFPPLCSVCFPFHQQPPIPNSNSPWQSSQ